MFSSWSTLNRTSMPEMGRPFNLLLTHKIKEEQFEGFTDLQRAKRCFSQKETETFLDILETASWKTLTVITNTPSSVSSHSGVPFSLIIAYTVSGMQTPWVRWCNSNEDCVLCLLGWQLIVLTNIPENFQLQQEEGNPPLVGLLDPSSLNFLTKHTVWCGRKLQTKMMKRLIFHVFHVISSCLQL